MEEIIYKTKEYAEHSLNSIKQKILTKIMLTAPTISKNNMIRMIDLLAFIDSKRRLTVNHTQSFKAVKKMVENNHPNLILAKKIMNQLSEKPRYKLVENFFVNGLFMNRTKKEEFSRKYGFNPPFFFVMSPTMRCNLRCKGCYAGKYEKEELSFELMDRIMQEAKDIGIYFISISGGEQFIRKQDLLKLFKKHDDMYFQVYTNGTLIDKKLAKELRELGNVACAISIEGYENHTDLRRGKGIYKKVMEAMDNLKAEGIMFGFSAVPTRSNAEILCSEEFFDLAIEKGCLFGWFFQYIPIGMKPDTNMMMTPEQRNNFRESLQRIRKNKPIFAADFWNDGPYMKGCMAGGKTYFHITSRGDVEPCVFIHFAVDNVKEKTLKEVLNSGFFKEIRKHQPCTENHLRPCMVIDNPKLMREACHKFNAKPTHPGSETIIKNQKIIKFLNKYSKRFKEIVDPIWEETKDSWEKKKY